MACKLSSGQTPDGKFMVTAIFDPTSDVSRATITSLIDEIIEKIAERYVHEHYADIVQDLDQQAIANLAIANAGKQVAEQIAARPIKVKETKTEVYEKGFFSGMRRIR